MLEKACSFLQMYFLRAKKKSIKTIKVGTSLFNKCLTSFRHFDGFQHRSSGGEFCWVSFVLRFNASCGGRRRTETLSLLHLTKVQPRKKIKK